ncbi:MAG: phosphatase PAP2 family protein, partial [Kofleriaceae bacterium]
RNPDVTDARSLWLAGITAVLAAIAMLFVDEATARLVAGYQPSPLWSQLLAVLEHAMGLSIHRWAFAAALVAGAVVTWAHRPWRWQARIWLWLATTHVISRLLTNELKDATGRVRPPAWLEHGGATFGHDGLGSAAFPSGHVALFASVIVPLAIVAPRTRPLLAIVVFVAIARIVANAHWVSDTLAAVTLVALVAWALAWVLRPMPRRTA